MKMRIWAWVAVWGAAAVASAGDGALVRELAAERDWAGAALECRRLALEAEGEEAAQWHWWAAQGYLAGGDTERARKELDRSEDAAEGRLLTLETAWLRGMTAGKERSWGESGFYFRGLRTAAAGVEPWTEAAVRGEAMARIREGDGAVAAALLEGLGAVGEADAEAVWGWEHSGEKKPWLGGLLGVVPGLGYAYSGEWGNAFRSLILNGIFGWALVETASEDQWGLFAVCAFLETTWWSGSIYGGVDAARRWNRREADEAAAAAQGGGTWRGQPDWEAVPAVVVRFGL